MHRQKAAFFFNLAHTVMFADPVKRMPEWVLKIIQARLNP